MPSLKLRIISAKNLPTDSDSYCKIKYGDKNFKTKIIKKNSLPEWNETFTIEDFVLNSSIQIELILNKKIGSNKLGTINISSFNDLIKSKEKITWESEGLSNKAEVQIGITPIDFGKEPEKKVEAKILLPPMPSEEEINKQYFQLMETLGFGKDFKHPTNIQTKAMAEITLENKWAMICQHKANQKMTEKTLENTPKYWSSKLNAESNYSVLREFRIHVSGQSIPWIKEFIEAGGLSRLLEILGVVEKDLFRRSATLKQTIKKEDEQQQMQYECLKCILILLNNHVGLEGIMQITNGIRKIVLCIDIIEDLRLKIIKLLSVICVENAIGYRLVVEALTYFRQIKKEKLRFETIVSYLSNAKDIESKIIYLSFINTLVNTPTDIDVRVAIRNEFDRLQIENIFKTLRNSINIEIEADRDLENLIDSYEESTKEDYKEIHERFSDLHVNINNIDDLFKTLKEQLKEHNLTENFLAALQNFLIMLLKAGDSEHGSKNFLLACRIIRQISLNKEKIGVDNEEEIHLSELLTTVETESKEILLNKRINELENDIILFKKRIETLEIETREKDDKISNLKVQLISNNKIENIPSTGDNNIISPSSPPPPPTGDDNIPPPPPPGDNSIPPPPFDENAPPPPPPGPGAPPPPPMGGIKKVIKKKPRKIPAAKMKGLQWNKIPENKIKGTIFEKFELEYKKIPIDYQDIEENFSQKLTEKKETPNEKKQVSIQILDPKTSQNISIFLSQFKSISHEEICKGLKDLNQKMFTPEQVKQVIQFLPTKDDILAIQSYLKDGGDISRLPSAERFVLELDKIPMLEQRLQAFNFKLGFDIKKADIKPNLEILKVACKELKECTKFPDLLEIILEIGNFINEGTPRGGVFGFKLSSLLKMADTKSTDNSLTLLQYLVKILEKNAPELLKFSTELPHVEEASKISLQQLTADFSTLQKEFNLIDKSLENFKEKERFVDIMKSFISRARDDLEQINQSMKVVQDLYTNIASYYGEDPKTTQPEDFFGTIIHFIHAVHESVKQNEMAVINAEKMKRREEAKAKRQNELELKKKNPDSIEQSVVDELFGALKGGNFFKNRRQQQQQKEQQQKSNSQRFIQQNK